MGEAKQRGSFEERKRQAIDAEYKPENSLIVVFILIAILGLCAWIAYDYIHDGHREVLALAGAN